MEILGIDIGGSGIKGAVVNTTDGTLITERHRIATPQPATPEAVAETVSELTNHFSYVGSIGCGFPALIRNGLVKTAANIDKTWLEVPVESLLSNATGQKVFVINDADAAGLGELRFGAGNGHPGMVMVLTIGTGIGSAIIHKGILLPATELGHLVFRGKSAEKYCSDAIREREDLTWERWGKRLNNYLLHLEMLFSPDLFILGGGVSKKFDKFKSQLVTKTQVMPASLQNMAGIIGAACYAADNQNFV
ncbi:MAG: ROK family protein [Bacteroidales bacterium]|jgi:polyphosphate glucokinase|nr:ROK family protein [Bacteroidales bacterium]HOI31474.1 ROK family protein [Bacteroidales bacterium]